MKKWLIVIGAVVLVALLALIVVHQRAAHILRAHLIEVLNERFASETEIATLHISWFPRIEAAGQGLVLRYHGRRDVPPLISIRKFTVQAGATGLFRRPYHIRRAIVEGLVLQVPPREREETQPRQIHENAIPPFDIAEIIVDGAVLKILPRVSGKTPHEFDIARLRLHSVGLVLPMLFDATLSNPTPPGEIHSSGQFGPWQTDDPGATPVAGNYIFRDADLSVWSGLAGTLSSDGNYRGELDRIEVEGTTDTPDFALTLSNHPMRLTTQFSAVVDGTTGDTFLQPLRAQFLHSAAVLRGSIEGRPGQKGKTVALDAAVSHARVEDLLRLALPAPKPFMTGEIGFRAKMEIPPGQQDILDKLILSGQFGVGAAQFTNADVEQKMSNLSHKALGQPGNEDNGERVLYDLKGRFALKDGVSTFSGLDFTVPGARIHLDGTYGLRNEQLDFRGTLSMQAKLSQTTKGIKSFLLKAVDPFFKKNGAGTFLHIRISGTRENPQFGLDRHHKMEAKK